MHTNSSMSNSSWSKHIFLCIGQRFIIISVMLR